MLLTKCQNTDATSIIRLFHYEKYCLHLGVVSLKKLNSKYKSSLSVAIDSLLLDHAPGTADLKMFNLHCQSLIKFCHNFRLIIYSHSSTNHSWISFCSRSIARVDHKIF